MYATPPQQATPLKAAKKKDRMAQSRTSLGFGCGSLGSGSNPRLYTFFEVKTHVFSFLEVFDGFDGVSLIVFHQTYLGTCLGLKTPNPQLVVYFWRLERQVSDSIPWIWTRHTRNQRSKKVTDMACCWDLLLLRDVSIISMRSVWCFRIFVDFLLFTPSLFSQKTAY